MDVARVLFNFLFDLISVRFGPRNYSTLMFLLYEHEVQQREGGGGGKEGGREGGRQGQRGGGREGGRAGKGKPDNCHVCG